MLFLDRKNILIADEVLNRGTIDHTPVYPREIVKRALELARQRHHPGAQPSSRRSHAVSRADIEMTREIDKAAKALGIAVHDHLVIGRSGHASFKALGLL